MAAGRARHVFTGVAHGDLGGRAEPAALARRRGEIAGGSWTWLRQVHGADVVTVTRPGEHAGAEADAAVTAVPGAVLAVQTADCAPVLLVGDGAIGVAHAGWRGLEAGVVERAAAAMAALGHPPRSAVLGPCIRARCYEFGPDELDQVAERLGPGVRATTAWGTPALDVAAGVRAACTAIDVELFDVDTCTACSSTHWSHRARQDPHRQALVAWLEP